MAEGRINLTVGWINLAPDFEKFLAVMRTIRDALGQTVFHIYQVVTLSIPVSFFVH